MGSILGEWSYVDIASLRVADKISGQTLLKFHQNSC